MNQVKMSNKGDFTAVLKKYQGLKVSDLNSQILEGYIDIEDSKGDYWGKYQVKIILTNQFPYEFPKMFETGGKIPKEIDWHIYPDESCCTTVRINELLVARNGITILKFLDEFGVPYLANHKHKELTGQYASGEYSHGIKGYLEFFQDKLHTQQIDIVFKALSLLREKKVYEKSATCFCGSGRKFKKCHAASIHELSYIPKEELSFFFAILTKLVLLNPC